MSTKVSIKRATAAVPKSVLPPKASSRGGAKGRKK
jgi:hypothetical protein